MNARANKLGPGKTIVSLYFDAELVKRIDRLAAADDTSRSRYIERLVTDGIEQEERTVRVLTDPVIAPTMMKALASPEILRAMAQLMRQDMTDDQLQLFTQTMAAASDQVEKRVGRVRAKRSPERGRRKNRK